MIRAFSRSCWRGYKYARSAGRLHVQIKQIPSNTHNNTANTLDDLAHKDLLTVIMPQENGNTANNNGQEKAKRQPEKRYKPCKTPQIIANANRRKGFSANGRALPGYGKNYKSGFSDY